MEMLDSKWKKVTFPVTRKRESSHMCARQTRMLSNQRLPPFQPVFTASLNLVTGQNKRKSVFPPGCALRSASDGLHRRIANTSKRTWGTSVSLRGPRYSGSKPQRRFSRGKNIKDAESLDKLMLRGGGNAPPSSSMNCSGASRTQRHAHGISRHASEKPAHPKHAGCLVPSRVPLCLTGQREHFSISSPHLVPSTEPETKFQGADWAN